MEIILWNVGSFSTDYTALYSISQKIELFIIDISLTDSFAAQQTFNSPKHCFGSKHTRRHHPEGRVMFKLLICEALYKLWSFSSGSFSNLLLLSLSYTKMLIRPSTLFSKNLSLWSYPGVGVRKRVSYPYKTKIPNLMVTRMWMTQKLIEETGNIVFTPRMI
jgi:hypothetical protein